MANWFTKRISGLDFWDTEENRNQRQQFAQEDEEERKRKREQAAQASLNRPTNQLNQPNRLNQSRPGDVFTPQDDPLRKPPATVGSQSDFTPGQPLQKPSVQPAPPVAVSNAAEIRQKAIEYKTPRVQDVGGYYAADAKILEDELAKGDQADLHRVQGLMASLDNRTKELKEFHNARGESTPFKSARELQDTIKATRGDWTKQNEQLKQFWDGVSTSELADFNAYLRANGKQPATKEDVMAMVADKDAWKNGTGQRFAPDFSGDVENVKSVQMRQQIVDAGKPFENEPLDQLDNRTIASELSRFKVVSPEEQRGMLQQYEDVITQIGDNPSANPEQERKAQQAMIVYNTLLDSGAQRDNLHTRFNKVTDAVSKFGGALVESPKHVIQSIGALAGDDPMGDIWNDWQAGKLTDDEFNAKMNQAKGDYSWVPEDDASTAKKLMIAAGTSADTVATFLPVVSFMKGIKGAAVFNTLVKEGVASGLTREAAEAAAKESLARMFKEGGAQSLKRLTAEEAVANAGFSGVGSLRTGEFDPGKTVQETVLGGAIGGASPYLGSKASAFWNKLRGAETVAPEALEDVGRVTTRLEGGAADSVVRARAINPETASRMSELQAVLDDPSIPSYQKLPMKQELEKLQQEAADDVARSMGVADEGLDKPAFEHKQEIQKVISEEEAKLTQLLDESPGIPQADIEAAQLAAQTRALARIKQLQDARFIANTATQSTPNIPDVESPIVLAKGDNTVSIPVNETPMADFSKAVDVPLQKAERVNAAPAKVEATPEATAEGNAPTVSDVTLQNQLEARGTAAARGESVVGMGEGALEKGANQAAREEVLGQTPAARTREQMVNRVDDSELQRELIDLAPEKERVNLAETDNIARGNVNNLRDEDLIIQYSRPQKFESPQDLFEGLAASRRLQALGTDEARQAVRNIVDAVSEQSSKSGLWQRASQVLFEDMPTEMKVDYLIKKVGNAGVEMTDADRGMLVGLIERSDSASDALRKLQEEATSIMESGAINNKSMSAATRERVGQLSKEIQDATRAKELASGDAWRFYQDQLPKGPLGKRFADIGRTMMLSSPTGRAFDVLSTTATTVDDLATQGVSNLIGKGVNLVRGGGTVADTILSPRKLVKGFREGLRRVGKSFKGQEGVEDFMTESRKATRGDIGRGGVVRKTVRAFVEAPTELTRGLQEQELFRQGMQEASQQGLKGGARRAYAELRAVVPSKAQLEQAVEVHMKANMLHNNKISRVLNNMANSLDKVGNGVFAAPIRNQLAPFTSWVGGNLHRTLTDKNVIFNAFKIAQSATRKDLQGVIDNVAKLGVNTGEAYAAGMLLTKAGIITTEDANGDSYGGLYFHIGNRYIPVAIAGTMSIPLIWGNAVQQAFDASEGGESPMKAFGNSLIANTVKNTGVQSVFGGENTFQNLIASLGDDRGDPIDAFTGYLGDFTRQYIPGLMSDVNALLDYNKSLNPSGEAALTKVTEENPETGRDKTNVGKTEWNKTLNKIPFASQNLPRDEGKPARDIVDRVTKGNHETGTMVEERGKETTLKDMEKGLKDEKIPTKMEDVDGLATDGEYDKAVKGYQYQLAKAEADPTASETSKNKIRDKITQAELNRDGVPTDDDGIKARTESGDYGLARKGLEYQLSKIKDDDGVPESKKKAIKDDITRLEVTEKGNFPSSVIALYSDTSNSEWRALGNPDSEDYNLELYNMLGAYDEQLAAAGVSRSAFKGDKTKYSPTGSGSGGGRGGKKPKFGTDIATQNFKAGGGFTPMKAQAANFAVPGSAIPVLEKAKNYDSSKLKKITVRKGA